MADTITIIDDTTDARYQFLKDRRYNDKGIAANIKLNVEQIEAAIYGQCLAIEVEGSHTVFLTVEQSDG